LIALPYGKRTDWLKNVIGKGSATIVTNGHAYEVERPEVIPMAEATAYFRPREQRMHRQFRVDSALQVRQRPEAHQTGQSERNAASLPDRGQARIRRSRKTPRA
jgi:hypothetical protein